jgi:hypothetical protein
MNARGQLPNRNLPVRLLCSQRIRAGSANREMVQAMSQKNGAIIHVERGYQIAEVLEVAGGAVGHFVGYRVLGPGAQPDQVFGNEDEARLALSELLLRHARAHDES